MRLLGLIPLVCFTAQFLYYLSVTFSWLANLVYPCNIGTLIMAIGLFTGCKTLVRMTTLWLVVGIWFWVWYVASGTLPLFGTSTLVHIGGLSTGMYTLYKIRASRWTWLHTVLWYLLLQLISRLFLPAALNINVAHSIWKPWDRVFGSYWQFWAFTTGLAALILWAAGKIVYKLVPPSKEADDAQVEQAALPSYS